MELSRFMRERTSDKSWFSYYNDDFQCYTISASLERPNPAIQYVLSRSRNFQIQHMPAKYSLWTKFLIREVFEKMKIICAILQPEQLSLNRNALQL